MLVVLHFTQALTRSVPFSKRTTWPLTVEPWGPIVHFSKADSWALRPNLPGTNPLVSTRLVGQNLPSRGCPVSPSPQRSRHSDFLSSLVFFFVSSAVLCCEHCSQRKRPKKKESQNVGINTCIHDQMARSKWLFWCQALSIFAAATFFWACLSFGISLISFLGIPKCFSTVALTPAAPSLSQRLWTDLEGDFLHLPSFLPCDRLWHKLNLECNECI